MRRIFSISLMIALVLLLIFSNSYYALAIILVFWLLIICSAVSFSNSDTELSIVLPDNIVKGENANLVLITKQKGLLPVARIDYTVVCENALVGEKTKVRLACSPFPKSAAGQELYAAGMRIGKIDISVSDLKIWDFFGLFSKSVSAPQPVSGLIYPDFRDIDIIVDELPEIPGEGERYYPDKRGWDVNELLTLRDYKPGDEPRSVHWKLTSKMDQLIVRDFGLSVRYAVMVIIELHSSGENACELLDECVETALSLSLSLIKQGISHNLAWYTDKMLTVRELANADDMQLALPDLLAARSYTGQSYAMEAYIESDYAARWLSPIYVTTVLDTVKMSEVSIRQPLKTYYISGRDDRLDDVAKHLDITIVDMVT